MDRSRPPAIVIGLDSITGLQSARILARHGIPVIGIASSRSHPCCRTRICVKILSPDADELGLIRTLEDLGPRLEVEERGRGVLFPCTDASVGLISRHRSRLTSWYRFALPDAHVIELLTDKELFYRHAQREGLPIPHTVFLESHRDARKAARSLRFPSIVKPAVKTPEWRARTHAKAFVAYSGDELLALYDRLSTPGQCLIAQALVQGPDREHVTCNVYFDAASRPLVTFVSRKLRQWPPRSGEGCLSEESRNDPVLRTTLELFQELHFHGLAYLEMKRDRRTGSYFIIEPNAGRPTGRSANAEAAGVELLYTQYCDLLGQPLPDARHQRYEGMKWIHTRRDLQAVVHHVRRRELTPRELIDSWRGPMVHALFSWRDPVPFVADFLLAGSRLLPGRRRTELAGPRPDSGEVPVVPPGRPAGQASTSRWRRRKRAARDVHVRVLTYHRVIEPKHPSVGHPGLVSATPSDFERQVRHLERRYDIVSAARVLEALRGGPPLPRRPVLITFDDAYADFAEFAWPILRRRGHPVTLFVPTAYPDDPDREFWWDRLHRVLLRTRRKELLCTPLGRLDLSAERRLATLRALQRWLKTLPHLETLARIDAICRELGVTAAGPAPVLGWDALRRLAAEGVTLAPHTRTHPRLDRLPLETAAQEIRGSREDLEREVGPVAPIFAYPYGSRDTGVCRLLERNGFEVAFTQGHGRNSLATTDPLGLRRTNITRRTTPMALALRLTSTGARLDGLRLRLAG